MKQMKVSQRRGMHGVFDPLKRVVLRVALFIVAAPAASVLGNEWIGHISPDGGFAVHCVGPGSIESAALVALPARKEVIGLGSWEDTFVWSPDSRRFARTLDEGPRVSALAIHERSGKSFKVVSMIRDFPNSNLAAKGWPKEWQDTGRGTQYIHPIRWLDANTLLVGVSVSVFLRKGEESNDWKFKGEFTVKIGSKGAISKSKLTTLSQGLGDARSAPPKFVSDHLAEPQNWQVSPDHSVALVEAEGVLDLLEQPRDQPARVTHLKERIEELLLPNFHDCGAQPFNAERPFCLEGAWLLQGRDRVEIHGEATTNPDGTQRSKMWCARLDAVWSIAESKFIEHKIVRGFCGVLGEDHPARVAARSPGGAFRIELREQIDARQRTTGEYKVFVVPEKADGGPAEPLDQRMHADEAPSAIYRISPDERWILAEWGNSQASLRTIFARSEGLQFAKLLPPDPDTGMDGFEKAIWDFCSKTAGLESPGSRRELTFVAWAPDSSRLLLSLRVDIKGLERQWKVYWNTRTRTFELTPYLVEVNAHAYDIEVGTLESTLRPFCAEPIDPLPALDLLDREVNAARQTFMEEWTETAAQLKGSGKAKAEKWRAETLADIEKDAAEFSRRWPEAEREQWRRLSLAGSLRSMSRLMNYSWPWQ